MTKCIMILPYSNNHIPIDIGDASYVVASYIPPPSGAAPYILTWFEANQSTIDALASRNDCLLVCYRNADDSFQSVALQPTERNAVRTKIANMGFNGGQYGLLNAAIQASQNRSQLAYAIATKAFYRDVYKNHMTNTDVDGTKQNLPEPIMVVFP